MLRPELSLTVGTKLEHNDYTGFEVEPNVRLSGFWTPNQALWSAVSRAVRTPSRIDSDLSEAAPPHFVLLKGGSDFESETVIAYELGYRAQLERQIVDLGVELSTTTTTTCAARAITPDHHSAAFTSPTTWRGIPTGWSSAPTIRCRKLVAACRLQPAEGTPARQAGADGHQRCSQ